MMASAQEQLRALQDEISRLHQENDALKSLAGPVFTPFPRLPKELRLAIWKCALRAPQIHIFNEDRVSRSHVNVVMQSCSEARTLGLSLKLPYYQLESDPDGELGDYPRYYMNPSVDTILGFGKEVQFFCGREKCASAWPHAGERFHFFRAHCRHQVSLQRLALVYNRDLNETRTMEKLMEKDMLNELVYMDVQEVMIVTGVMASHTAKTVQFQPPSQEPASLWGISCDWMSEDCYQYGLEEAWVKQSAWLRDFFVKHKLACRDGRQRIAQKLEIPVESLPARYNEEWANVEAWTLPRVSYVEFKPTDDWMHDPTYISFYDDEGRSQDRYDFGSEPESMDEDGNDDEMDQDEMDEDTDDMD